MSDPRDQSPAKHSGHGHVRILIGLAAGVLAGLIANVGQQPDLGGGVIQQYFGGAASFIDRVLFDSDPAGRTQFVAWLIAVAAPIGKLFLRLMQMMVLPLVVSALFLAVVDVGDFANYRIGLTTLFYTAILSISAVLIGITLVNVVQPGRTISPAIRDSLKEKYAATADEGVKKADAAKPLGQTLVDLLPENPVQEMVGAVDGSSKGNGMLAVMFFALLCGIASTTCLEETTALVGTLRGVYQISMTVIGWVSETGTAGCRVSGVCGHDSDGA
ncbi:MAG: cation:dicarboxylase symporter family transporter [Planctomycetaceae bacterium]